MHSFPQDEKKEVRPFILRADSQFEKLFSQLQVLHSATLELLKEISKESAEHFAVIFGDIVKKIKTGEKIDPDYFTANYEMLLTYVSDKDTETRELLRNIFITYQETYNLRKLIKEKIIPSKDELKDSPRLVESIVSIKDDYARAHQDIVAVVSKKDEAKALIAEFTTQSTAGIEQKGLVKTISQQVDDVFHINFNERLIEQYIQNKQKEISAGNNDLHEMAEKLSLLSQRLIAIEQDTNADQKAIEAAAKEIEKIEKEFKEIKIIEKEFLAVSHIEKFIAQIRNWDPKKFIDIKNQKEVKKVKDLELEAHADLSRLQEVSKRAKPLLDDSIALSEDLQGKYRVLLAELYTQTSKIGLIIKSINEYLNKIQPKTVRSAMADVTDKSKKAVLGAMSRLREVVAGSAVQADEKKSSTQAEPLTRDALWKKVYDGMHDLLKTILEDLIVFKSHDAQLGLLATYLSTKELRQAFDQMQREYVQIGCSEGSLDHRKFLAAKHRFEAMQTEMVAEIAPKLDLKKINSDKAEFVAKLSELIEPIQAMQSKLNKVQISASTFLERIANARIQLEARKSAAERKQREAARVTVKSETTKESKQKDEEVPADVMSALRITGHFSQAGKFNKETYQSVLENYAKVFAYEASLMNPSNPEQLPALEQKNMDKNALTFFIYLTKEKADKETLRAILNETVQQFTIGGSNKIGAKVMELFTKLVNDLEPKIVDKKAQTAPAKKSGKR